MNSLSAFVRTGLLGLAIASIPLSTGCGMDVGVSGSTGTGGHDDGAGGGCSGGVTGAGGATTSTATATTSTSSTSSAGTGGEGAFCGGIAGIQCAADEYCDFPANNCGNADDSGTCKPRPMACDAVYFPTCGCDGQIYGNDCTANTAGHDVAPAGFCTPPVGMFACGQHFCNQKTQYCEKVLSDVSNWPDDYFCLELPGACLVAPSCSCIAAAPCGNTCAATSDGGLMVTCPGG